MTPMGRIVKGARLGAALLLLTGAGPGQEGEKRDRAWLVRTLARPIPAAPRTSRYLALINRSLNGGEAARPGFPGPAAAPGTFLGLDAAWFQKSGQREYRSRAQTNALGRLAFCIRTPGLRYHGDPAAVEVLRQAYRGVARNVSAEGKFTWEPKLNEYGYDSERHEHAWRLEPLLLGLLWAGDRLEPEARREAETALRRAADWLAAHPLTQTNNRGAVWCAVLTLAGLFFENAEYLAAAERHARPILDGVVLDDGEIGEHTAQYGGGGPCTNYTYTGWSYVYLYWRLSGRSDLDEKMLRAGRWLARYHTLSGCPVVMGASVRRCYSDPGNFQDVLPSYERLSRKDPFFAVLADRSLARLEANPPPFGGHIVSPLIWAMLEEGAPAEPGPVPGWYTSPTRIYERPEVHYALVGRSYQTGLVFRGRTKKGYDFPFRGMQTFAWGEEPPILHPTDTESSTTSADGIDTATTNVDKGPSGWEVVLWEKPEPGLTDLAAIAERRKGFWTVHAYTPVSAVVVHGGAKGEIRTRWVMNPAFAPPPNLDEHRRRIAFAGRKGRIHFLGGKAVLSRPGGERSAAVLEVTADPPMNAFAFSDETFRFAGRGPGGEELSFADASGQYRLSLKGVLGADGHLDRNAPMPLVRTGRP